MKEESRLKLIFLRFKLASFNFVEFLSMLQYYFICPRFCRIDFALWTSYFFHSPYACSKRFLEIKGEENLYTYGETPLSVMGKLVKEGVIKKEDNVFELGCGRGRVCFWLAKVVGCRVKGVDYLTDFVNKAQGIQTRFGIKNLSFENESYFKTDLEDATVIYFYAICSLDREIKRMVQRFNRLKEGVTIITVSFFLKEYDLQSPFEVVKTVEGKFPWGQGLIYIQQRKGLR